MLRMLGVGCLLLATAGARADVPRRPAPPAGEGAQLAPVQPIAAPKLLARYFVAVRPDASTAASRTIKVKSRGSYSGAATVVVRRVTDPATPVATRSGSLGGRQSISVALPANGTSTSPYCLEGQHHYQVSVWSGAPGPESLALQNVTSTLVQACRGDRAAWFDPQQNYPGGTPPGPGAGGAPPAYAACLEYEAKVKANPTVLRPGDDPWPDPDPGIAVNPTNSMCR